MSKKLPKILIHNSQPMLVKLGTICGRPLFVELQGPEEQRELEYLRVMHYMQESLGMSEATEE